MPDSNTSFPGIIDYVAVHGSKTLEEVPLSAVDGLLLSVEYGLSCRGLCLGGRPFKGRQPGRIFRRLHFSRYHAANPCRIQL